MADQGLDDFFAKKDKSKKKPKSKSTPTDILPQGDEAGKKTKLKKKEKKKEKETKDTENKTEKKEKKEKTAEDQEAQVQEEWEDFEQEQEVDYTGLRIGTQLQIGKEEGDKEKEEETGSDEEDECEEGQERKEKKEKGADGPWNQKGSSESAPRPPPKQENHIPVAAVTGGKYVPPSRRGLGGGSEGRRKGKKEAPNLTSERDFPTLGGGPGGPEGGHFEEVRSSGRQYEDPAKRTQQLELGNKFGALQE